MKILALDVATLVGVAFGRPLLKPSTWTVDLSTVGKDYDARYSRARAMVTHLHETCAPDLIAIEAPIGGSMASRYLIELVTHIKGRAFDHRIRTVEYNIGSVRKHFIGKHFVKKDFPALSDKDATKIIKGKVLTRCRALGWEVAGYDEADAAALFDYACSRESRAHQVQNLPGLFQGKAI
jgi:hypothetical protein